MAPCHACAVRPDAATALAGASKANGTLGEERRKARGRHGASACERCGKGRWGRCKQGTAKQPQNGRKAQDEQKNALQGGRARGRQGPMHACFHIHHGNRLLPRLSHTQAGPAQNRQQKRLSGVSRRTALHLRIIPLTPHACKRHGAHAGWRDVVVVSRAPFRPAAAGAPDPDPPACGARRAPPPAPLWPWRQYRPRRPTRGSRQGQRRAEGRARRR